MHPERAARLLADLGILLFLIVFGLRGVSMMSTARQGSGNDQAPPAFSIGNYHIAADGKTVTFQQQTDLSGKTGWMKMPLSGGQVTAADAPGEDDIRPFTLRGDQVFLQVGSGDSLTTGSPRGIAVTSYALSPDREKLAFAGTRIGGRSGLYILYTTSQLDWLGEEDELTDLVWSPDGKKVAFIGRSDGTTQVFWADLEGQQFQQVTGGADRKSSPAWSPDSKRIAYRVYPGQNGGTAQPAYPTPDDQDEAALHSSIFVVGLDGAEPERLADNLSLQMGPAWILGGSEIAYAAPLPGTTRTSYLYALNPQTRKTRQIDPPLTVKSLTCPDALPRGSAGPIRASVQNNALIPLEATILLRAGPRKFLPAPGGDAAAIEYKSIRIPPGETRSVDWTVQAVPGIFTHVSALIPQDGALPLSEQHCRSANYYLGLPNLPLLPLVIPLTLAGAVLCLPWLRHRRNPWLWAALGMVPVLIAGLIFLEISRL